MNKLEIDKAMLIAQARITKFLEEYYKRFYEKPPKKEIINGKEKNKAITRLP
jgi:hypothetical protein